MIPRTRRRRCFWGKPPNSELMLRQLAFSELGLCEHQRHIVPLRRGRKHLHQHREQHLCHPLLFNSPRRPNASSTISHTTPHLLPAGFSPLLSSTLGTVVGADWFFLPTAETRTQIVITSPHFPLSAKRKKEAKKDEKKTTSLLGEAIADNKIVTPGAAWWRAQHGVSPPCLVRRMN